MLFVAVCCCLLLFGFNHESGGAASRVARLSEGDTRRAVGLRPAAAHRLRWPQVLRPCRAPDTKTAALRRTRNSPSLSSKARKCFANHSTNHLGSSRLFALRIIRPIRVVPMSFCLRREHGVWGGHGDAENRFWRWLSREDNRLPHAKPTSQITPCLRRLRFLRAERRRPRCA